MSIPTAERLISDFNLDDVSSLTNPYTKDRDSIAADSAAIRAIISRDPEKFSSVNNQIEDTLNSSNDISNQLHDTAQASLENNLAGRIQEARTFTGVFGGTLDPCLLFGSIFASLLSPNIRIGLNRISNLIRILRSRTESGNISELDFFVRNSLLDVSVIAFAILKILGVEPRLANRVSRYIQDFIRRKQTASFSTPDISEDCVRQVLGQVGVISVIPPVAIAPSEDDITIAAIVSEAQEIAQEETDIDTLAPPTPKTIPIFTLSGLKLVEIPEDKYLELNAADPSLFPLPPRTPPGFAA